MADGPGSTTRTRGGARTDDLDLSTAGEAELKDEVLSLREDRDRYERRDDAQMRRIVDLETKIDKIEAREKAGRTYSVEEIVSGRGLPDPAGISGSSGLGGDLEMRGRARNAEEFMEQYVEEYGEPGSDKRKAVLAERKEEAARAMMKQKALEERLPHHNALLRGRGGAFLSADDLQERFGKMKDEDQKALLEYLDSSSFSGPRRAAADEMKRVLTTPGASADEVRNARRDLMAGFVEMRDPGRTAAIQQLLISDVASIDAYEDLPEGTRTMLEAQDGPGAKAMRKALQMPDGPARETAIRLAQERYINDNVPRDARAAKYRTREAVESYHTAQNIDRIVDRAMDGARGKWLEKKTGLHAEFNAGQSMVGFLNRTFVKPIKGIGVFFNAAKTGVEAFQFVQQLIEGQDPPPINYKPPTFKAADEAASTLEAQRKGITEGSKNGKEDSSAKKRIDKYLEDASSRRTDSKKDDEDKIKQNRLKQWFSGF